jgi:hypothetical protein
MRLENRRESHIRLSAEAKARLEFVRVAQPQAGGSLAQAWARYVGTTCAELKERMKRRDVSVIQEPLLEAFNTCDMT